MNLDELDLGEFMDDLGNAGVTMMLKVDDVRLRRREKPWTVLLSSAQMKEVVVRKDCETLEECLRYVFDHLSTLSGNWKWLDLYY